MTIHDNAGKTKTGIHKIIMQQFETSVHIIHSILLRAISFSHTDIDMVPSYYDIHYKSFKYGVILV